MLGMLGIKLQKDDNSNSSVWKIVPKTTSNHFSEHRQTASNSNDENPSIITKVKVTGDSDDIVVREVAEIESTVQLQTDKLKEGKKCHEVFYTVTELEGSLEDTLMVNEGNLNDKSDFEFPNHANSNEGLILSTMNCEPVQRGMDTVAITDKYPNATLKVTKNKCDRFQRCEIEQELEENGSFAANSMAPETTFTNTLLNNVGKIEVDGIHCTNDYKPQAKLIEGTLSLRNTYPRDRLNLENRKDEGHVSESDSEEPYSSDDSVADPNYSTDKSSSSSDEEESVNSVEIIENNVNLNIPSTYRPTQSENCDSDVREKTRKRKALPLQWKRNKIKVLRNSGQAYNTLNKGSHVEARKIKMPCNDKCTLNCTSKFLEEDRRVIFQKYWDLADLNKQRAFIVTLMNEIQSGPFNGNRRARNNAFYLFKGDNRIRVCKVFFVSTLGITNRTIRSVINKRKEGDLEDKRGKHGKQKKIPEALKNDVRAHINSIPKIESHYTRAHSDKECIEGGKTVTDLYTDYKQLCESKEKPYVTLMAYRNIFNYEFNLAFFVPKKDQCSKCVSYQNASVEEKKEKGIDHLYHQKEKQLSREEKQRDKDKISDKYQVSCFDLQATLPTPRGEVSTFYYRSKLSTYNFTICDLSKNGLGTVMCFMWHEGQGKRGPNEIGTCLLKYLEEKNKIEENIEIIFYSDNCSGQQKNKFVLAAYFYAISKFRNIKSITHKYLVSGHTQNEGDNVHSVIEKNIKRALRSGPIYTPDKYVMLVQTAKKTGHPYRVVQMSYNDFFDLKQLSAQISFNYNKDSLGQTVKFNDASIFKVERETPDRFYYKTSFGDSEYKTVYITQNKTRTAVSFSNAELVPAYVNPLPITKKKHTDLMYLINSNTIPKCHSYFYTNLKPSDE